MWPKWCFLANCQSGACANFPTPDSLDVVQQPLRARMCGFGDKVRRWILLLRAALLEQY